MGHRFFAQFRIFAGMLALTAPLSCSGAANWEQAQSAGHAAPDTSSLTPQLMIMPLPLDPAASEFPNTADPMHPLTLWMRVRGTPIGYVPVPVSETIHQALWVLPPNPTRLP